LTDERVTGLLTGSAGLSTHTTVLHAVLSMSLALVTAEAAGGRAGLEGRSNHVRFEGGLARDNATSRITEIGTIEIEPDAAGKRFRIGLAQTRISARRASLRAIEASADTGHKRVICDGRLGMRLDHRLGKAHGTLPPCGRTC
jgi:hypothetical protein